MDEDQNPLLELPPLSDEEIWLAMWHTTTAKPGCINSGTATHWADQGLADFQARFRRGEESVH